MRNMIMSLAAASALAIAAPAAAQYSAQTNVGANANLGNRIGQLQARLQAGVQSGAISRREAVPLRQQLRHLTQLERQYSRNGLTGQERADLQQRIRAVRQQLRVADGGARGRYDQSDNWDRADGYGQSGQYGDRIDSNNDGYDDRDYDRDGRWDDDARNGQYGSSDRVDADRDGYDDRDYNRDGRWDDDEQDGGYQQPAARGGIGGLIDSVLGGGGLRVGQRASSNLYGVPSQLRNQYRDGNGVYYRTDNRQIYQIDARTQTVVRVYPMGR